MLVYGGGKILRIYSYQSYDCLELILDSTCAKKVANRELEFFRIKFKDNYKVSPTCTILAIKVKRLETQGSVAAYWVHVVVKYFSWSNLDITWEV